MKAVVRTADPTVTIPMTSLDLPTFRRLAQRGNFVALVQRVMSDQLTPVLAYRRLVGHHPLVEVSLGGAVIAIGR